MRCCYCVIKNKANDTKTTATIVFFIRNQITHKFSIFINRIKTDACVTNRSNI